VKPTEVKKNRRNTLRSAFSTVGNSVSQWIPNFNLAQRRHSFPTPTHRQKMPQTPKKKKNSIISMMTGMFHRPHQKSSFTSSDSDSDVNWANNYDDGEDVFVESQQMQQRPSSQFPDLTKVSKPTNLFMPVNKRPSVVHEQEPSPSDKEQENDTDEKNADYQNAETPTLAEAVIPESKPYLANPTISIDTLEESEICEIDDEPSELEPRHENTSSPRRYILPKQFSLDVSQCMQNEEQKDDSKSNHSWCSTMSKTSSRRQSTEESIDTEDEWYMYEFRKLENLERHQGENEDVPKIVEEVFKNKDDRIVEITEVTNDLEPETKSVDVTTKIELPVTEMDQYSSGETSGPDSPVRDTRETELETIQYEEEECDEEETKDAETTFYQNQDQFALKDEEEERMKEEEEEEEEAQFEYEHDIEHEEEREEREERTEQPEDDDKVPGTPSLPRFKYDKSESAESPHASREEISKDGPLGSKWKLLKTLKERKAEEKSKESESPPPTVSTPQCFTYYICIYTCVITYLFNKLRLIRFTSRS
jgi:protein unc-13